MCPLLLFFSLNLRANSTFELKGSLSFEFSKKNFSYPLRNSLKENENIKTTHLDLFLKSHFWSKNLLKYNLFLNVEKGQIKNSYTSGNTDNLGYGFELEFFPYSAKKFSIFLSKQNYLYDKSLGFDYERKTDGYGFNFLFNDFKGFYKNLKISVPNFKEFERKEEEGQIRKNFLLKNFNIFTELKRNSYDYDYFNTSQDITSALFTFNSLWEKDSSLDGRLNFQDYTLIDKGFDLKQNLKFLNFGTSLRSNFSPKTQSILTFRGSKNFGDGEVFNGEEILRFSLYKGFRLETLFGFFYDKNFMPLGGLGLIYERNIKKFSYFLRGGISYRDEKGENFERKELSPFGNVSFSFDGSLYSSSLDLAYYSINYREFDFTYEELPKNLGYAFLTSRDDFWAKFQFNFYDKNIYFISFKSIYNQFSSQYLEEEKINYFSLLHQVDFSISFLKFGFNYYQGREEGINLSEIKAKGTNFSINLLRNLYIFGSYLERDKKFSIEGKEMEKNLQISYSIGKFNLKFWYQGLDYGLIGLEKKVDYFRIVLLRNFESNL